MWVAERYYSVLGTPMLIRFASDELTSGIDLLLGRFRIDNPVPVRGGHQFALVPGELRDPDLADRVMAYRNCARIATASTAAGAIAQMMAAINRQAVEACEPFAVHAGVVARDGGAMALPVDSMGGKSTLTAALLSAGLDYVSDEALVIDVGTEAVVPYPKALGLSKWSLEVLGADGAEVPFPTAGGEALVPPEALGATVADGHLELRHVVLSEFGYDEATLEEASGSEAMAALLSMSFNHYRHGAAAFHLVASLANRVKTWRLRYGDPMEAARLLSERLD